jgi:hypothetical protein
MKRYLIISLLALAACNNANPPGNGNGKLPTSLINNPHTANGMDTAAADIKPVMELKDTLYNFGAIHEGEVAQHEFTFTNTGKTPLLINSAAGSCGCTVPDYPHEPIAPGQSAILKVTFNSAGKTGHQEKSVSIQTNTLRSIHMIYIQADIIKQK